MSTSPKLSNCGLGDFRLFAITVYADSMYFLANFKTKPPSPNGYSAGSGYMAVPTPRSAFSNTFRKSQWRSPKTLGWHVNAYNLVYCYPGINLQLSSSESDVPFSSYDLCYGAGHICNNIWSISTTVWT